MASLFRQRSSFWHRNWSSTTALSDACPGLPETDPCMICYVPVGVRTPEGEIESWSTLPCGHRFGSYCVKRWLGLAEQPACPICRTPMTHACGHPVLPLPTAAGDSENGSRADGRGCNDSDSHVSKKLAFVSQNTQTAPHTSSPTAGCSDSPASSSRSLSRFRRKRRLSVPGPSSVPVRIPLDTQAPCEYCSLSLMKQHAQSGCPPGAMVRLAFRVLTPHARHSQSNSENAYWERWRKDNSTAFGMWWAAQQPPTEPARELPAQGWVL